MSETIIKMKKNTLNHSNPKVSIIVPVYGVEAYLQKCIDSLVSQTFNDIEIILIDDGSKDGSGKICDDNALLYPGRVRVVHQANTGLGGARNTGIKIARAQYVMFVDSDDYLRKNAVEKAYAAITDNDADIVAFGIQLVNDDGRVIKSVTDGHILNQRLSAASDARTLLGSPSAWNKIYKTKLFAEYDVWFPPRAWHEDVRTTLKLLALVDSIVFIPDHLYYYVQREGSITHNSNVERNREIIDAVDDLVDFYKSKGLFEKYYDELEFIAILNMYNAASARVALVDPRNALLEVFQTYLSDNFPAYRKNKYIHSFGLRQKVLYFLTKHRLYTLINIAGTLRSRYDGRS